MAQPQTYSIKQAAELWGCSEKTIRRRIADGSIKAHRIGKSGRLIRIKADQLEKALAPLPAYSPALAGMNGGVA
ncbi:excisionase family DNA-binding protein [Trueperella pyogenes]